MTETTAALSTRPTSLWQDLRATSFSQGWFDAKGIHTRYLHSGKSTLPPLILLHGVGGHAEAYIRNLDAHGRPFNTWAIDLLGHGWTDKPDHPYELPHYVDHLLRFIDAQGWDKAHTAERDAGLSAHESKTWLIGRSALGARAPTVCTLRYYRAIPEIIAGYGLLLLRTPE